MHEIEIYQTIRKELSKIEHSDKIFGNLFKQYSQNMRDVFPERNPKLIIDDFRRTLFYQRLAYRQQQQPFTLDSSQDEPLPATLIEYPGVILTAHTYSYRNIVRYLAQKGLPLCLLVARNVYDRQQKDFVAIMEKIYCGKLATNFRLIEAEDPAALLKLRRAHKQGMYLIGYVDGNTGSNSGDGSNKNLQLVSFGSSQIRVRTGLFRIAQWLGCPVHSVWTKTGEDYRSVYKFQQVRSILTNDNLREAVEEVYASLVATIQQDPAQWECFLYLEDFLSENS